MGWGDELMACGEAMAMNGDVAIVDASGSHRWHMAWENNPKIKKPGEKANVRLKNASGARPYIKSAGHNAWEWQAYRPKPAKFYFSDDEQDFADMHGEGFVVVQPHLKSKQESINRDWGWDNFAKVTSAINADWVQLGETEPKLLPNARWIRTPTPRHMAAILSKAKAFLAPEGGIHHTAAAFNLRGVVLFGGFIAPQVTGYSMHKNIFIGHGLGCGKRVKCTHCADAWAKIEPERIIKIMAGLIK
jgi:ADP-heptose:LPS heptosyltransferase